jgi:hypothetical protein
MFSNFAVPAFPDRVTVRLSRVLRTFTPSRLIVLGLLIIILPLVSGDGVGIISASSL